MKQPFITANSQTKMNIIIYRDPSTKYPAPYTRVFPIYSTRAAVAIRNSHNSHTTIALGPPAQRDRIIRSNPRPVHVMPIIHSALEDAYVYSDRRARGKTKRHDTHKHSRALNSPTDLSLPAIQIKIPQCRFSGIRVSDRPALTIDGAPPQAHLSRPSTKFVNFSPRALNPAKRHAHTGHATLG